MERASIREDISVVKYDVEGDKCANLRVELLLNGIQIKGLPTLLLFKDGKLLAENSGMSECRLLFVSLLHLLLTPLVH